MTGERPPRTILLPCPCCGHPARTINGRWLRYKREQAGLDQRSLAKRMHVSGPYLSDLERNRRECPPDILAVYRSLKSAAR
jgi:predicted transcriptional regulator